MSDIGDAFGTAVEGGLFAKAIDGNVGAGAALEKGHFAEGQCLNCGTELIGPHCHACGQKAHLHRTLGAFLHDLLHGALHFEGRTWKTLPKLFFKPGELTRRYIEGERARFVSPMALFLFGIFLMFAVFQITGISTPTDIDPDGIPALGEVVAEETGGLERDIAEIDTQLEDETISAKQRERLERRRATAVQELEGLRRAQSELPILREDQQEDTARTPAATGEDGETKIPLSDDGKASMTVGKSEIAWLDKGLDKWRKSPELMLYKLQTNFYKFSWLLIPLSIPFVWLLFAWRRQFKAYDHAIFVTYSLSFMSLLILATTLAGLAGLHPAFLVLSVTVVPALHLYKQLRGAYGISRFSAFWRLCVLTIFILIVLMLFLQLLLFIGAF